ncbi:MAG: hypothetical protein WEB00_03755 [Dehalococcoidia bacterium]
MRLPLLLRFLAAALLSAQGWACSSDNESNVDQDSEWGPLAVIDVPNEGAEDSLGGHGALRISSDCVFLELEGGDARTTLVWKNSQVDWDPERRTIYYESYDGHRLELMDGDSVAVGGAAPYSEHPAMTVNRS